MKRENPSQRKIIIRKAFHIMAGIIIVLLIVCCVMLSVLLFSSPGKIGPITDEKGNITENSISEKIYVNINGVKQGMFIQGCDINNPVILFVHGGPGMPEFFCNQNHPTGLEKYFTICWWEQRDSGISYDKETIPESVTVDQIISDTLAVSDYLRERFSKDKIYLLGHSFGSFIGIQAAAKAPDKYYAYVGIGQESNQLTSEKLAYQYMLTQYTLIDDTRMVRKLKQYPIFESDKAMHAYLFSNLRDSAMHKLGIGTMHDMDSVFTGIFLPVMQCHAYTLPEKINLWKAKAFLKTHTQLMDEMYAADLPVEVPRLEIPTYFISGKYDYTVNYNLSKEYVTKIQAPLKGFYTFENCAHSPIFEEPEKFITIMLDDVCKGSNNLAD